MPLVNKFWKHSFADKEGNMKAIRERGWNLLNYRLLSDQEIIATQLTVLDKNNREYLATNINPTT